MTFLEQIVDRLQRASAAPVVQEIRDDKFFTVPGGELLALMQQARAFLAARGMKPGERCVLLAPNSIRWIALDLALMAEGMIVVPLYARQAVAELISMMKDSAPSRIFCHDAALAAEIKKLWPQAPHISLLESVFVPDAT
ncbi:MAG: AMP-binding protein, partial [Candidatus Acidiferrales bacterium]